jgi:hypothetical protein
MNITDLIYSRMSTVGGWWSRVDHLNFFGLKWENLCLEVGGEKLHNFIKIPRLRLHVLLIIQKDNFRCVYLIKL